MDVVTLSKCPFMTTDAGVPIADNQNSLTAGERVAKGLGIPVTTIKG